MELIPVNKTKNILKEYGDVILLTSIYSLSILIPLLIQKPQLLVGTLINTLIVFSSLKFGIKKSIPVLLLPSLVSFTQGVLFGSATVFLLYFLPFIIFSNFVLSFSIDRFKKKEIGIVFGILLKVGVLFLIANIFVKTIGLPNIFLTTMGANQLVTAVLGSVVGYVFFKLK